MIIKCLQKTDFDWGLKNCNEEKLNHVKVGSRELLQLMKALEGRKAEGPDEISGQALKL